MNDVQAIANVVYSYPHVLDSGDFDALGDLFEHAVIRFAGSDNEIRGADAARTFMKQAVKLYDGIPRTRHLTSNLVIEIDDDGDHARSRSYFTALQAVPGFPLQPILVGRWDDSFRRIDGRWRFVERLNHVDLTGDAGHHLANHGIS